MAAVARLTRNLSQERATVLAKEAIELSTAGNVQVRDNFITLHLVCMPLGVLHDRKITLPYTTLAGLPL
jgi:hypothetical protein